ncbi:hypothetical protein KBZ18_04950 [Synechococcus sp. Cruz-9H2]|uniref:DUF6817 domain-containing protein n=1 Tax=unclassified Synechococcus TaxID=2626047 RepID=UPI0020CC3CCA|nr:MULTISPECIES: hypothetical protein [unclassified Synechococcus]MCP9818837.1 hypothetical protein [Synechococcus sp. Cruz-9H2]MCP9843340.1 hypothetical protein [Synechococcus sp. Edmonson 11F2]MCP9855277.1 hypothetical protein [Synechococcus sp. Cruz-9C9]MCP9862750.1 hypothetical protein [Synechococcus sp. Cruz-7E5]MCP9869747.1 hypothetical protein [Synechococcus sp. Cruz-7B9]
MPNPEPAHTHIQLLAQLTGSGHGGEARRLVFEAYHCAASLCSGFQPCGTPFLLHLLRTASLLDILGQPIEVTAAGLLHSAYRHGDFGEGSRGFSPWKRPWLRRRIGSAVEGLVYRYEVMPWSEEAIAALAARPPGAPALDRPMVLMRLVNAWDQCRDGQPLFRDDWSQQVDRLRRCREPMVRLARFLDQPVLAEQLDSCIEAVIAAASTTGWKKALSDTDYFRTLSSRDSLLSLISRRLDGLRQRWGPGASP